MNGQWKGQNGWKERCAPSSHLLFYPGLNLHTNVRRALSQDLTLAETGTMGKAECRSGAWPLRPKLVLLDHERRDY